MNTNQDVFSVTGLNVYIRHIFDLDELLQDVWVEGEISGFNRHASGHWYFTLKDKDSQLKAVMWKTSAARQQYIPEHGEKVRAHGRVTVYEARGEYQLYCDAVLPLATVGDLHAQFRQIWDKLEAEGLFSPEIKRPLPPFPRRIGVVTSPTAAAFQDIQNVLRRRWALAEIILSPTPVQGNDAPPQILRALRLVDSLGVDVILLARGGGSMEDLWCFNDERIARAIRETHAPVVTGVGHETDITLVDGAADQRAPTPSAGAEMITPSSDDLRMRLRDLKIRSHEAADSSLEVQRDSLDELKHKLRLVSPVSMLRNQRQRLDEVDSRMRKLAALRISGLRDRLNVEGRALELANPRNLLRRGYALITRAGDGKRISNAVDAGPGTSLHIQLGKGTLTATVKDRTLDDNA
ncbi:MAG: exodeoxyribonuclease VII large subunit [Anaerolineae bacterium]|nr:exodeoxyribonuclease VII large subunit [Anaerolineae bacterium]